MRFKGLHVENIRSYRKLDLSFDSGVTVVCGINGSGKSSLLESCFTGLFGSKTLSKDFVLSDMISKGATKASISLEFEQNDRNYVIEQGYRNDPENGRASNTKSVLRIDGDVFVDQATQTYDAVRSLLNMDEEAYKNCVYIRQGEIDVLINAKPRDRQRMIDDLLQIGKLEEYRERASGARVGVGRHQRDVDARIKDISVQIESIGSTEPVKTLDALRTGSMDLQSRLDDLVRKRDVAKSKMEELRSKISEYGDLSSRKDSVVKDISNFNDKKGSAFKGIESLRSQINGKRSSIKKLQQTNSTLKAKLGVGDADMEAVVEEMEAEEKGSGENLNSLQNRISLLEKDASQKEENLKQIDEQILTIQKTIDDLGKQIESKKEEIKSHNGSLDDLDRRRGQALEKVESLGFTPDKLENIDDIMDLLTDQQKRLHGRSMELSALSNQLERKIEKNRQLLEKGMCPTCGQDLQGSHIHKDTESDEKEKKSLLAELENVKKDQDELVAKLERVKSLKQLAKDMSQYDNQVQLVKGAIQSTQKLLEDHTARIIEEQLKLKTLKETKDEIRRSAGEINKKAAFLRTGFEAAQKTLLEARNRLALAKDIRKNILEMERILSTISQLEDRVRSSQEMIELFEGQIAERRQRLHELEEKLGGIDISALEAKLEQYSSAHENITSQVQSLNSEKEGMIKEMGRLENEIKRLSSLEDELEMLKNKMEYLKAVYEDAETLEAMYVRIRAQLRARNIDVLDSLINEIFSFMYSNNAYSHIRLDSDYNLTIYEKDGTPLEPKLLSGGERALFNLVLRCAIYRLLSMGVGGSSSNLPPLILDEPTVFLDRGHVQQLIKLVEMMRNIGVGQIIIVSHDESLIDSADHVFQVEKDPVTNTSAIYRV